MSADIPPAARPRDRRLAVALCVMTAAMVGMAYAAVPLYSLFCKATGYGGTTQVATAAPLVEGKMKIVVRFDSNVSGGLGWTFLPEQAGVTVTTGETKTVSYKLQNDTARETVGIAAFNVQPEQAGQYFNKIQCFCFTEQSLKPGESRDEDVVFFIDPAIEKDPDFARLGNTITLSYTFFPAKTVATSSAKPAPAPAGKSGNS